MMIPGQGTMPFGMGGAPQGPMPQPGMMPPQGSMAPQMPPDQLQPFGPQRFPQPGMESWFPQLGAPANGGNTPLAFRPHLPQGFGFQGGAEGRSPFGFGGY